MKPTVAVIIPVHNMADTLARAVESAGDADEIYIINDGSTDETMQIAVKLPAVYFDTACNFPAGVCYARNLAINACPQELIVCLDADDYFLPGGINALRDAWQPRTLVYASWRESYDDGTSNIVDPAPVTSLWRKNLCQATYLFSKADWQAVGGYKPKYNIGCEDWELMVNLIEHGIKATRILTPVYNYTRRDNGRAAWCAGHFEMLRNLIKEDHPTVMK